MRKGVLGNTINALSSEVWCDSFVGRTEARNQYNIFVNGALQVQSIQHVPLE